MSSNSSASSSVSSSAGSSVASQETTTKQEPVADDVVASVAATNLHVALNTSTQQQQPRDAAVPGDNVDDYEHGFWENVFDANSTSHDLMDDDDCGECKRDPEELMAQQANEAMDTTSTSVLLDQWGQYDDPLTDFASTSMSFGNTPSSTLTPGSGFMFLPNSHLPSLFEDHQSILDHTFPSFLQTPRPPNASYVVQFPRQHDGTPLTLSKPIVREDGVLLVGTESVAASEHEKNRIFVTNFLTYTSGQPIAFIAVDNEVRDMHWINAATAIVAVGNDIQLIDVSNGSCRVRAPIKSIHSDSIRELAVGRSTYILSGGFDETVVVTDLHLNDGAPSNIIAKFDAHDVVSSLRWSPSGSQFSWTTDGGDFQVGDMRTRSGQLHVLLKTHSRVDTMGGLFTHEYLTSDTIVLGFEHGHTAFIDIRMPRAECCYSVMESPLAATGEIRRSKTNKYALFGLGGYLTADLNGSGTNLEHVEKNQFSHTDLGSYKTSGDFSFDSGATLAVSDNLGQVSVYTTSSPANWASRTV